MISERYRVFFGAKFECFRMLFGAPTITAWRVEFNMASCCGSSDSSDESGAESSDVFSETATRKFACIPFMCTLIVELCGQELDLVPHRPRVGTKPGVGHGLPVVNFPDNKKSKTKQMYRIVRVHSTHTVYRQIQVYSFPRLSLLHSTLNLLFPFLFSQKPIRLQAIRLHKSILRLRNVTSG